MFGLKPKAPISAEARVWVEEAFARLAELQGRDRFLSLPVILPTVEFFPNDFQSNEESLQDTLDRVCGFMQVDPRRVVLDVFDDLEEEVTRKLRETLPYWEGQSKGAAGTYQEDGEAEKFKISVKRSRLKDPMTLIAVLAHELGHVRLLGDGRLDREAPDMEPLTDLVTVFWGLGVFNANAAARFSQYDDGTKHGWSMKRLGYLSEPTFAYALAVFAYERGERNPLWAKYLTVNVGTYFRQSLKFLAHSRRAGPS